MHTLHTWSAVTAGHTSTGMQSQVPAAWLAAFSAAAEMVRSGRRDLIRLTVTGPGPDGDEQPPVLISPARKRAATLQALADTEKAVLEALKTGDKQ